MAERQIELDGIKYFTLLEHPSPGTQRKDGAILFCHALMSNLHMYHHTVKALNQAGYTTLRFDLVGHGKTSAPEVEDSSIHLDDIAKHMHNMVQVVTGQRNVKAVIGCSVGGVVTLRYATLFPGNVERAIAIAAPGVAAQEASKQLWTQRIEQLQEDQRTGEHKLAQATVNRWFPHSRPEDDAIRAESLEQVKTCSLRGYKIMADAIRDYDYAEEVRNLKGVKCLVVAGSEDSSVSPGLLKDISATIPGAKFVKMEGAGHLPSMHKPEEFEEIVLPFLEG